MSKLPYGPNSVVVACFIHRLKDAALEDNISDTAEHQAWLASVDSAMDAVRDAARDANSAWSEAWHAARDSAQYSFWIAGRDVPGDAGWAAAALVVSDLITAEKFAILVAPFKSMINESMNAVSSIQAKLDCDPFLAETFWAMQPTWSGTLEELIATIKAFA
jgi:hypothetical protein